MAEHITDCQPSDWSYKVFGCRCDDCCAAHARAMKLYRDKKKATDDK